MVMVIPGWLLLLQEAAVWQVHVNLDEIILLKIGPISAPRYILTGSVPVATINYSWLLMGLKTSHSNFM